ncbi:MAG TPA: energy transducer TonB [Terriglobales bacterium]|nr:energy transducer TonB [Terriglobales bacterium]
MTMEIPADTLSLGILPEHRTNWRSVVSGYGSVTALILLLINFSLLMPQKIELMRFHTSSWLAVDLVPAKPELPHKQVPHKLLPSAPIVANAKLMVPPDIRSHHSAQEVVAPKIDVFSAAAAPVIKPGGARPDLIVHTGEFGSSATPTLNAPVQKVQTGGFGDPNGIHGEGKNNARLEMAGVGSFDLPPGPGKGNGAGGANGTSGTIASAGFGSGIASPGRGDGRSLGRGAVQTAGFANQAEAPVAPKQHLAGSGPNTSAVEITYKPNPVYTQEARQLKLEGEVLLEVTFGANGQLHVNRVVRGLGHGLDEAAMAAAAKMRFKPAMNQGEPVDSTAIVHVVFQLAY